MVYECLRVCVVCVHESNYVPCLLFVISITVFIIIETFRQPTRRYGCYTLCPKIQKYKRNCIKKFPL